MKVGFRHPFVCPGIGRLTVDGLMGGHSGVNINEVIAGNFCVHECQEDNVEIVSFFCSACACARACASTPASASSSASTSASDAGSKCPLDRNTHQGLSWVPVRVMTWFVSCQDRGNAIVLLVWVLESLRDVVPARVVGVKGGDKHNAIPREASAIVLSPTGEEHSRAGSWKNHRVNLRFLLL